ncbi:MAG TPA: cytochrome P450 [Gordonia polyisoprenivorans]|uniref:Cytochrome P450 n=1 Tax=Gordonia polyisoprenivorans TaxID=84595 RepID=A0A846WPH2_9ACTN|nr:cytochrome P450 [Gordonia polyisoprenivorans]NKY02151.1 cytochrome P450 [Gordonia polyisoprenivorans]OZC31706.1 cytochrome P450 [Gordonia polyisoprenivorans]QUD83928.1 cytochrome P450 [Gordonia polyisoprenivorans]GAB21257.1 cytochrome P450 51 [Gordonia polyisoprenivorans NBRC 16320 = JCM 10675]HCS59208.1 cytochrome P450 [Gordonia polyisoprenivorans]
MTTLTTPKRVSGGDGEHGHLDELATDPIGLFWRVREECGDVGQFQLADREVVLVSGAAANEEFFRAPEEDLDQAAAYPFMTPVFGEGVVFDASPEERSKAIHNSALKGAHMKQHAVTIPNEAERIIAGWGDEGEIDLLEFFGELTLYTSSACLIGRKFREQLDKHVSELFHDLEKGTDPIAYVDAHADIESFRRRDAARAELVEYIQGVMGERVANPVADKEDRDLMDVLIQVGFDADTITGMFISMMFAGHHTTQGTAAWTLIELLRNPEYLRRVYDELDEIYGDTPPGERPEYTFAHTRQMPLLENALKEALRLHPPLIILMRLVQNDFHIEEFEVKAGQTIAVSPAVSNRLADDFPDPDTFDPDRYLKPRQEDLVNRWTWIPFGAGRHRCVGAQFAIMQLKAIFSVLFQNYEFEMAQPADSYHNDHSKMVVQLAQPCRVRYRKRVRDTES